MKKVFVFVLSLSALALTSSVFAEPVGIQINVNCPIPADSTSALANYGDFIAGNGIETVQGQVNSIYFKSKSLPDKTPSDLRDYHNEGASYDSTKGEITCQYTGPGPQFSVVYTMTNGKGGFVSNQTQSTINIRLPVALVK